MLRFGHFQKVNTELGACRLRHPISLATAESVKKLETVWPAVREVWNQHMHFMVTRLQSQPYGAVTSTEHVFPGERPLFRRDGHQKWQSGRVVKDMSTKILQSSWGD